MADYYLYTIDEDLWRDFKALATLEGQTIRDKLLKYIAAEVEFFRTAKFSKETLKNLKKRGGQKKWPACTNNLSNGPKGKT